MKYEIYEDEIFPKAYGDMVGSNDHYPTLTLTRKMYYWFSYEHNRSARNVTKYARIITEIRNLQKVFLNTFIS